MTLVESREDSLCLFRLFKKISSQSNLPFYKFYNGLSGYTGVSLIVDTFVDIPEESLTEVNVPMTQKLRRIFAPEQKVEAVRTNG